MNSALKIYSLPQYTDYVNSIIAFVDILGFDSKVRNIQSETDFNNVAKALVALKEMAKHFNEQDTIFRNLNITAISDSLILTMPEHDESAAAMSLIVIMQVLQYMLLEQFEMLVRGYLTKGPVYHKEHIVFGKGYSEAYKKEGEIGHAPRIVIDPALVEEARAIDISAYVDHIFNHIKEDSCDGYYFVDYLRPVKLGVAIQKEPIAEREKIKKFTHDALTTYNNNKKILQIYKWLDHYIILTETYYKKM
jgi:hypothetical protein